MIGSVVAREAAPIDAPYNKVFDPWRACMDAEALAVKGAPDALRTLFLAAYVRVYQPFLGGEDLITMCRVMEKVLVHVGDSKFSRSLAGQRPEIRSAVAYFLHIPPKRTPKTAKVLRDSPDIDFPMHRAYRDDR